MNPIIKSLVRDFARQFELPPNLSEDDQFEYFSAFCVLNAERLDQGDFRDALTDKGEEGIDFIAIIANGILITDVKDLEELAEASPSLSVTYVFGQSKSSEDWDGGGVLKFTNAVTGFFSSQDIGTSEVLDNARDIHSAVISYAPRLIENPQLRAYFIGTGPAVNAKGAEKYLQQMRPKLQQLGIFSDVRADLLGGSEMQHLYRAATTAASATIEFASRVTLPPIQGVDQAYLGLLPARELLTLLTDSKSGEIRKSVFEDNVRDFQGPNAPANRGMRETIRSSQKARFSVLNNGITIIVRALRIIGNSFTLSDYQIVNGAQTSHVLFENRDQLTESAQVFIPTRLIQTTDEDLITQVVTATNSQTQIQADQLNARALAERNVEKFFAGTEAPRNLLYERRSRQYDNQADVVKARVIDRYTLLRAMAASFTDEPHLATGYPGQLVSRLRSTADEGGKRGFFSDSDEPALYYAAATAHYRLDLFLKTQRLDAKYKPARWHLLMIARHLELGATNPDFSSKKARKWIQPYVDTLWDDTKSIKLFHRATEIIDGTDITLKRANLRNATVTTTLLQNTESI
ncbi:MAG: AIPR family protein [Actinobacteria bacterium]|nr:AIPR family protein [Actinomycetota bacterium]